MLAVELFRYLVSRLSSSHISLSNFIQHDHSVVATQPKVSIIIPTRDRSDLLRACVGSIRRNTLYENYEIVIVDNGSVEAETLILLENYRQDGINVLLYPGTFNYSAICNFAVAKVSGDFVCLLNNDVEIVSPSWLDAMMKHAVQKETGVVGGILTYPNGKVQHMGIALGLNGVASHPLRGLDFPRNLDGRCYQVSGVTFALALMSRRVLLTSGGLDEGFSVGLNDVDLCLRFHRLGYKNVVCTESWHVHHESLSRGNPAKIGNFISTARAVIMFLSKYGFIFDPFFSKDS